MTDIPAFRRPVMVTPSLASALDRRKITQTEPDTIRIDCPSCGITLVVDEAHLGKTGRCKCCRATFPIRRLIIPTEPVSGHPGGQTGRHPRSPQNPSSAEADLGSMRSEERIDDDRH